jgi:polysaccharide biosynthesis transport protein
MDDYGASAPAVGSQRFFVFLKRYWWVLALSLFVSLGAGIWCVLHMPAVFVSTAAMWETEKLHLSEGALFTDDSQNYIGTQIELLKSDHMWRAAIERLRTIDPKSVPIGKDGLPIPVKLTFKQAPKSVVFSIEASSPNAAYSQNFLNTVMNEYLAYKTMIRKSVSGDTAASIATQVETLERELKAAEDALTAFQRTNDLAVLEEEGTMSGGYLAKLQAELSDLKLESQILDATAIEQNSDSAALPFSSSDAVDFLHSLTSTSTSPANSNRMTPVQELALLKMERERLSKHLRPKHPRIVNLDAQIARAEKLIEMFRDQGREQLVASQKALKMRIDSVSASIKEWEPKVSEANARIAEAERLKLNLSRTQGFYDRLSTLLQNVDISRNTDLETLAILETASAAKRSFQNQIKAAAAALVGGLGFGIGLVFLIAVRDDRFTSATELTEKLGQNIVGLLPEVRPLRRRAPVPLLEADDARHMYAESYRSLRSALLFMAIEGQRPKTLLITSALPGEGKSTVAANLSRTLALGGARVLLVDGDLRKGVLHDLLELPGEPGLSELLQERGETKGIIQRTTLPNLSFLARGGNPINPGELFLGPIFERTLAAWREQYDYVLIDSSPVFAADDATTIAPAMDGTIFVVRRSRAGAKAVREALELLYQRQARVLGVIFNGVSTSGRSYYHYKYADYYYDKKTA